MKKLNLKRFNILKSLLSDKDGYSFILPMFKKYRRYYIIVFIFMLVMMAFQLVLPYLSKILIDDAIGNKNRELLLYLVIGIVMTVVITNASSFWFTYYSTKISQDILINMRKNLFKTVSGYSLNFFTDKNAGDISARLYGDVNALLGLFPATFFDIAISLGMVGVSVSILITLHWRLSLFVLTIVPPMLLNFLIFGKRVKKIETAIRESESKILSHIVEKISGILLLKLFAQELNSVKEFINRCLTLKHASVKLAITSQLSGVLLSLSLIAGTVAIFWYGGSEVIAGTLSFGSLIAFLGYMEHVRGPIAKIGKIYLSLQSAKASLDRVHEYMRFEKDLDLSVGRKHLESCNGQIEFQDVSFGYLENTPVISNLSFKVLSGETLNIVGDSGDGKTTLTYLMSGLLSPQSGKILIDDNHLEELDIHSFRNRIGFVSQKTILFNDTIEENIKFGRPGITDEMIVQAAKLTRIHGFIESLPSGYKTVIGTDGSTISGGQQQRLAIARALANDPSILILDEATSNLDYDTAIGILMDLQELKKGRTTIFISHHLSPQVNAEKIINLGSGKENRR